MLRMIFPSHSKIQNDSWSPQECQPQQEEYFHAWGSSLAMVMVVRSLANSLQPDPPLPPSTKSKSNQQMVLLLTNESYFVLLPCSEKKIETFWDKTLIIKARLLKSFCTPFLIISLWSMKLHSLYFSPQQILVLSNEYWNSYDQLANKIMKNILA